MGSCAESPHESAMWHYPNPRAGWEEVKRQFGENSDYELTAKEIVALIGGAHSLGDCNLENSGFEHGWDLTYFDADGAFVRQMGRDKFVSRENSKGNHQWYREEDEVRQPPGPNYMMNLNTDFAIIKNFTIKDESTGEVDDSCKTDSTKCAWNEETYGQGMFDRYQGGGGSVNLFNDFQDAYYKMLNKGHAASDIKPAPQPASSSKLLLTT